MKADYAKMTDEFAAIRNRTKLAIPLLFLGWLIYAKRVIFALSFSIIMIIILFPLREYAEAFYTNYRKRQFQERVREYQQKESKTKSAEGPLVAVVGSGYAGICMGVKLKEAGIENFVIYEKAAQIGGTWWHNTYPGCACDIPSHLYCFSFEMNPTWSRKWVTQGEILKYLLHVVDKYDLAKHIQLNTTVKNARWEEKQQRYVVTLQSKGKAEVTAQHRFLVNATGLLGIPKNPNIAGLETFKGPMIHTAQWRNDVKMEGKRVGVIGTGASAIQVVPHLANQAKELHVFQRSAGWIIPKIDFRYPSWVQWMFRIFPFTNRIYRWFLFWGMEVLYLCLFDKTTPQQSFARLGGGWMKTQVHTEETQALIPTDAPLCKRALFTHDWLYTFTLPHVKLVTSPIVRLEPDGIVVSDVNKQNDAAQNDLEKPSKKPSKSNGVSNGSHSSNGAAVAVADGVKGKERKINLDVVILASGFDVHKFVPFDVFGLNGVSLEKYWKGTPRAYLCLTVPTFPNFFILYGPNSNLASNSVIFMIECQVDYTIQCIKHVIATQKKTFTLKQKALDDYYDLANARLDKLVWRTGCNQSSGWYKRADGSIVTNSPWSCPEYWWKTSRPQWGHYDLS
jgi:cation diffusion facilitator CzcD-associated flavoprotein CzcO